jgi:hypothetical protein
LTQSTPGKVFSDKVKKIPGHDVRLIQLRKFTIDTEFVDRMNKEMKTEPATAS